MEDQLGAQAAKFGTRVLIHFGSDRVKKNGLFDGARASLEASGLEVFELGGVQPNPRLSLVEKGVTLCKDKKVDIIIALGGGSVIDSAKAIAMGAKVDHPVWDFYAGKAQPSQALPIGTMLTIPAAGSESSNSSVITNEDGDLKRGFGHELIYPRFSILNPQWCFTLPAYQVGAGASDIMAHLMERYFTNAHPVELTDRLLESAMKNLISIVPRVLDKPEDYDAWSELMLTGQMAHNNSLDVGRTGDWASHDIEHELSGIYDVTHGAGLAVVFPAWMQHVLKHNLARFVRWSVEVWGVEQDYFNPEVTAQRGIAAYKAFSKSIGMPITLKELNIGPERFREMAQKATGKDSRTLGNYVKLTSEDIYQIYTLAMK
jgi:alcohol dehydrogenase YqhD (iron-dependent ADH family)